MMSDMMSAMARGFGASMGEGILAGVAESRDGFRKAARDAKPPDKRPHPFDADACHRLDELAAHAETAGLSGLVDELTDLIACGKLTEARRTRNSGRRSPLPLLRRSSTRGRTPGERERRRSTTRWPGTTRMASTRSQTSSRCS